MEAILYNWARIGREVGLPNAALIKALAQDRRITGFTVQEQKSIIWKIDRRLVLTLGFLYMISLMDRTNLGAASIAGTQKELEMNIKNNAYTVISLVFFLPYAIFQPPATILIRRLGPRLFLAVIVFLRGGVMIASLDWQTMAVLRVILGGLEAGFYPGSAYLLNTWYLRYELQKRNAIFYFIGSTASAFAGILAYSLMQLNGPAILQAGGGFSSNNYLFLRHLLLPRDRRLPRTLPKSWRFFASQEADFIIARIEHDRNDTQVEPFHLGTYFCYALDANVWAFSTLYMFTTTYAYAIAYFLPIILGEGMWFSVAKARCLVAPPYVVADIVMFVQAYFGDKWHLRSPIIAFNAAIGIIGLGLLSYTSNNGFRYFGQHPRAVERALKSATLIGGGAIGGIIRTSIFRPKDAPNLQAWDSGLSFGECSLACGTFFADFEILEGE
ncbi:related to permease of the major facilitator superfamily [Phialocephala subalpina]|uniref:Related to permease of the major facilitator superfamily n=1 Tax=Phialocephala subalpina TaxID=576137 RepID=A0A1L7XJA1_9HELO|nr:related to permease of the major facilitator superfamily [Phialocephala subalpina]